MILIRRVKCSKVLFCCTFTAVKLKWQDTKCWVTEFPVLCNSATFYKVSAAVHASYSLKKEESNCSWNERKNRCVHAYDFQQLAFTIFNVPPPLVSFWKLSPSCLMFYICIYFCPPLSGYFYLPVVTVHLCVLHKEYTAGARSALGVQYRTFDHASSG